MTNNFTENDSEFNLNRRKLIAGAAGAGVVALAGCAEEDDDNDEESETEDKEEAILTRPRLPDDPSRIDDDAQRFLVESADYQNRLLEQIADEVLD